MTSSQEEHRSKGRRRRSADGRAAPSSPLPTRRSLHDGNGPPFPETPNSTCTAGTTSSPGMLPRFPSRRKKSLTPGQARWAHYARRGPGSEPARTISGDSQSLQQSSRSADSSTMFRSDDDEDFEMTDEEEDMMGDHLNEDEGLSPFVTAPSPRPKLSLVERQGRELGDDPARSRVGGQSIPVSLSSSALQQKVPGVEYGSTTLEQSKLEAKFAEQERMMEANMQSDAPPSPNQRQNKRSLEDSLLRIAPIPTRYGPDNRRISNVSGYDDSSIVTGHSVETALMRNTASFRQLRLEAPDAVAVRRPSEPFRLSSREPPTSLANPSAPRRISSSDPLAPSGHSCGDENGVRKRRQSGLMLMPMDEQGHAMSSEELREVWRHAGKCQCCGRVSTHTKIKYGPFGVFRRMQPITREGQVYRGYCLACHDMSTLRRVLNDPDIPEQCLRHNPTDHEIVGDGLATVVSHAESSHDDISVPGSRKPNGVDNACQGWKLQLLCFAVIVGSVVGGIFAAISFSRGADPSIAAPQTLPPSSAPALPLPSMAPSSNEWVWSGEIVGNVDTFGYQVDFNFNGTRIAIAAPNARQGRGQVEVYEKVSTPRNSTVISSVEDLERWERLGEPIIGDERGDSASLGMDLSGDGMHVVVGYPGNGDGFVRVFWVNEGGWTQKGQTLGGPSLGSKFGSSVALNRNGTYLAVGAPKAGTQEQGMFHAFKWSGSSWVPDGPERFGDDPGDHFGASVAMNDEGNIVVVGSPDDDTRWENGGRAQFFAYVEENPDPDELCISNCWADMTVDSPIWGEEEGYRFGHKVSLSGDGLKFASSSLIHDAYVPSPGGVEEFYENVGYVRVITYDESQRVGTEAGFGTTGDREGQGFGYDVALDHSGAPFVSTTLNEETQTGIARAYAFDAFGTYQQRSAEIGALPLGSGSWLGTGPMGGGPSVAMANKGTTVAVGYQSVLIHEGKEVAGVVRIFQNEATPAGFLSQP